MPRNGSGINDDETRWMRKVERRDREEGLRRGARARARRRMRQYEVKTKLVDDLCRRLNIQGGLEMR